VVYVKDYIVVDHGFCQSIGSLTYGKVESLSENSKRLLSKLMTAIDIDFPVYCHISAELSLHRIRIRNRQSKSGRLDLIRDDKQLKNALQIQTKMFDSVYCLTNDKGLQIEMDNDVESIAAQVFNNISCCSSINETH
jgi:hypothetical protein